jgi:flagellar biosynthesis/type III secretory pathway protein FliH
MLSQNELERERYEARRKAQMDHDSGLHDARSEGFEKGIEKGRQEGEKIGTIRFCEKWLNRPQTPTERLTLLSLEDLTRMADELQEQMLKQR